MTPLVVMEVIRAGFVFGTELLKFMQTKQGMELITKSLEDRKKWDSFWKDVGESLGNFFTGKLFKLE